MCDDVNLLIFEFVSFALTHRMIDRLGVARCTLRYGPNADGVARWSPTGWTGSLGPARRGGMILSTHLANKKLSIKY
jgi:hypothetical protein